MVPFGGDIGDAGAEAWAAGGGTMRAVTDAGSIRGTYQESPAVLDELAGLGIGHDDVVQTLEDQGVAAFDASWHHLGRRLARALSIPAGR